MKSKAWRHQFMNILKYLLGSLMLIILFPLQAKASCSLITNGNFSGSSAGWSLVNAAGTHAPVYFGNEIHFHTNDQTVYGDYIQQNFPYTISAGNTISISVTAVENHSPAATNNFSVRLLSPSGFTVSTRNFTLFDNQTRTFFYNVTPSSDVSRIRIVHTHATNTFGTDFRIRTVNATVTGGPEVNLLSSHSGVVTDGSTEVVDLSLGSTTTITYTVQNTGGCPLTLGSASASNVTGVTIQSLSGMFPTTVNPGQTATYNLTYQGQNPSGFSADIAFATNDANENPYNYKIEAVGDPYDYGDAPDTGAGTGSANYQTNEADSGAKHAILGTAKAFLGSIPPDSDNGALQNATAKADDEDGAPDDEDGAVFSANILSGASLSSALSLNVNRADAAGNVYVSGWIDFNQDGDFTDAGEELLNNVVINVPTINTSVSVPIGGISIPTVITSGTSYARFRVCSVSGECNSPTGSASDGEVEDYEVTLVEPVDCGIEPAGSGSGYASSGTGLHKDKIFWLDWSCGAVTNFNSGQTIRKRWDVGNGLEIEATLSNIANGISPYNTGQWWGDVLDDMYSGLNPIGLNNLFSRITFDMDVVTTLNGVRVPISLVAGQAEDALGNTNNYVTTNGSSWQALEAFGGLDVEFSSDGLTINTHDRLNGGGGTIVFVTKGASHLKIDHAASEAIGFGVMMSIDYGDANTIGGGVHFGDITVSGGSQPTTTTAGTDLTMATINLDRSFYMGANPPDAESSHQADVNANGDDANGSDDEDGVFFGAVADAVPLGGQILPINIQQALDITVTGNGGYLNAWIDWNIDGDFDDAGEQIITNLQDSGANGDLASGDGVINTTFTPPANAAIGSTYARFRFSEQASINASQGTIKGEVEDYQIALTNLTDVSLTLELLEDLPLIAGFPADFLITVTNDGSSIAEGLSVKTDYLTTHFGYLFLEDNASKGSYTIADHLWNIGDLGIGESETLKITLFVQRSGTHTFTAEISAMANPDIDSVPGVGATNGVDADDLADGIVDDDEASLTPAVQRGLGSTIPDSNCGSKISKLDWDIEDWSDGVATQSYITDGVTITGIYTKQGIDNGDIPNVSNFYQGGASLPLENTLLLIGRPDTWKTYSTLRFNLGVPSVGVDDLRFAIYGIDQQDLVADVRGYLGAQRVPPFITASSEVSVLGNSVATARTNYRPATGGGSHSTVAQIGFETHVDRIELDFTSYGNLSFHFSMADLTFCHPDVPDNAFRWSIDNIHSTTSGSVVLYPHYLDVGTDLAGKPLNFNINSSQGIPWLLYRDDGDGQFNASDTKWVNGMNAIAGEQQLFWLRTVLPNTLISGTREITQTTASIGTDPDTRTMTVSDVTTILGNTAGGGQGKIFGEKFLALDANCDGVADGGAASFTKDKQNIELGQCAVYQIRFTNVGDGLVSDVKVIDQTPNWTQYLGSSARYVTTPSGLTNGTAVTPNNGNAGAIEFPFVGTMAAGAKGVVEFSVRLQ